MDRNVFTFHRFARTSESEAWFIQLNSETIGTCNLHLNKNKYYNGDIILEKDLEKPIIEFIIEEIEEKLIGYEYPREDFALYVYKASRVEFRSDIINDNFAPSTKKDIVEQNKFLQSFVSKYQHTRGQLNEHVAKEYFEKLGFESVKASPELDALKVDLICENSEYRIFCQVKLGSTSERTIVDVIKSIDGIATHDKTSVIAILANSFPTKIELLKEELKRKYGHKIWTITKEQVLLVLPEYKKALK